MQVWEELESCLFEMESDSVALVDLELATETRLAFDAESYLSLPPECWY